MKCVVLFKRCKNAADSACEELGCLKQFGLCLKSADYEPSEEVVRSCSFLYFSFTLSLIFPLFTRFLKHCKETELKRFSVGSYSQIEPVYKFFSRSPNFQPDITL